LSDELLVETNHEFLHHLEHCGNCRAELGARRELRGRLKNAVINADESQMNPIFTNRLRLALRDQATSRSGHRWRALAPVFAALLIVVSIGFVWILGGRQTDRALADLHKNALAALNRHEDCGLNHLKEWQADTTEIQPEKTVFVKSLTDQAMSILEAHDCEFEGRTYTHYIMQRGNNVISVLQTNDPAQMSETLDTIASETQHGYQIASFRAHDSRVFVVSDLGEADNLTLARKLSNSL
jgi:hypothetical protein